MDRNDVSTRHNKGGWSLGSLQKVLRNTFYIGHYVYSDKKLEETIECECPAFLPETIWHHAQDKRKQTLKRKGQINKTKHFYMLRDFMYCGHCGSPMSGRKNIGKREQHYYCPDKERSWVTTPPRDEERWVRGRGCDMIKSLNIPRTDTIIFQTVLNTLRDTTELHEHLSLNLVQMIRTGSVERIYARPPNTLKPNSIPLKRHWVTLKPMSAPTRSKSPSTNMSKPT